MQSYIIVFIIIMLYMFQAVPSPIIRSSKLYTQHRVFVKLFSAFYRLLMQAVKSRKKFDKYPMLCIQL